MTNNQTDSLKPCHNCKHYTNEMVDIRKGTYIGHCAIEDDTVSSGDTCEEHTT